ncbi:MAG TPA: type II toxin-antitoxin system PemK/MazF family toxin [Ignavibacteria bacterium]|nr:type II toxin-antitoxin system PemK/MazF family toxin [Ignavibacteria bacterium]HMQ97762.1 type II toxin-antitoxin system PemK/MazF family toxin [Ignavibacteria bacterium]
MKKGEIVLVKFPFTDLSGSKLRPAMILAERAQDVLTAFITTNTNSLSNDEILIEATESNKLKQNSKLNLFKIAALRKDLVLGKLGVIEDSEILKIDIKLIQILNIKQ